LTNQKPSPEHVAAQIAALVLAIDANDAPTFRRLAVELAQTTGALNVIISIGMLANAAGREAYGEQWRNVVNTSMNVIDIDATEDDDSDDETP
jgi:hypothetical protein